MLTGKSKATMTKFNDHENLLIMLATSSPDVTQEYFPRRVRLIHLSIVKRTENKCMARNTHHLPAGYGNEQANVSHSVRTAT